MWVDSRLLDFILGGIALGALAGWLSGRWRTRTRLVIALVSIVPLLVTVLIGVNTSCGGSGGCGALLVPLVFTTPAAVIGFGYGLQMYLSQFAEVLSRGAMTQRKIAIVIWCLVGALVVPILFAKHANEQAMLRQWRDVARPGKPILKRKLDENGPYTRPTNR